MKPYLKHWVKLSDYSAVSFSLYNVTDLNYCLQNNVKLTNVSNQINLSGRCIFVKKTCVELRCFSYYTLLSIGSTNLIRQNVPEQRTTLKIWNGLSFAEYAWVCLSNSVSQNLTSNTQHTLTIDTEVCDTDSIGDLKYNQITLIPGVYDFQAIIPNITVRDNCSIKLSKNDIYELGSDRLDKLVDAYSTDTFREYDIKLKSFTDRNLTAKELKRVNKIYKL